MKLDDQIETLGLSLNAYNQCRLRGLSTVADALRMISAGELNPETTKSGHELKRILSAGGFEVVVNLGEVDLLKTAISVECAKMEAEIEEVRERHRPKLSAMRERLRVAQLKARERREQLLDEPSDAPVRYCATCGEEMLRATLENVRMAYARADQLLAEDGRGRFTSAPGTVGVPAVKRMRLKTSCCRECERSKGDGHSYLCFSKAANVDEG